MTPPAMAGWNLALRFGLELAALAGLGTLAWRNTSGPLRWVAAIGLPVAVAAVWAVFNVPDDPSRSGEAPVVVPGSARLAIELLVLGAGAAALAVAVRREVGITLGVLIAIHYATSIPRIEWLLDN